MRVKLSSNPPLPSVRVWFPLAQTSTSTVATFKSILCTSLPSFGGIVPLSLRLSIDGFELLDNSELTVVKDGDLISVDARKAPLRKGKSRLVAPPTTRTTHPTTWLDSESTTDEPSGSAPSRKRKRDTPTPTASGFESDTGSTSSTETSSSDTSGSESSNPESPGRGDTAVLRQPDARNLKVLQGSTSCVPPGHGKPQTRARNLRRRLKRAHGREAASAFIGGPVSGANAVEPDPDPSEEATGQDGSTLMSLSLRNKNKAKNFRGLVNRPLPPKIIFGEQEGVTTARQGVPRLVPPSERASLPPNVIVTSVDVEAKKDKTREEEVEESLNYEDEADKLEALARDQWDNLERVTRQSVTAACHIGYKALGIDPVTCTPGQVLTVGRVESRGCTGLVVQPLRAVSFGGHAEGVGEEHTWEEIDSGDWRVILS